MLSRKIIQKIFTKIPQGALIDNPSTWKYYRTDNGFDIELSYMNLDNDSKYYFKETIRVFVDFGDLSD
jgi:hypothetical protein